MIHAIIQYWPLIPYVFAVSVLAYFYCYKTHIDDVPQPEDDCPFWTGDPP
jgi:hypothetical protein